MSNDKQKLAEPDAPVAQYPNRLCHIDHGAHPYRCGCLKGDKEAQRIYDEHCKLTERAEIDEALHWLPLTAPGQVQPGDWLSFSVAGEVSYAIAREILNHGTDAEEVIYNRKKNYYFITSMVVVGTSSHKDVLRYRTQATGLEFYPLGKCPECDGGTLQAENYRYKCTKCAFECGEAEDE